MLGRTKLALCAAAAIAFALPTMCHAQAVHAGTTAQRSARRAPASAPSLSPIDLHNKFTARKPVTPQCLERGRHLIDTLRQTLKNYRDSKAAEAAGYKAYYADHELPLYHFASTWRAIKEQVRFDPAQPTALLYKKAPDGYQLVGVMYYAVGTYSEDALDARVPLCLARWHRQVNVCLPRSGTEAMTDPRFSADGTIATEAECKAAGGKWYPTIHGWMVEVYPFEKDPKKIWDYRPD
jgi:hypothetical protein